MTTKNKARSLASRSTEEDHGTITYLSDTQWITTYKDGTVVRGSQNRPNNQADVQWMFGMIHDLANHSLVFPIINKETAA